MASKKRQKVRGSVNVVTSCISTTLVLVLLGTVVFFVTVASHFSSSIRENFTVSLLLDDDLSQAQTYNLQTKLKAMKCARLVTYISKERALQEQTQALGTDTTKFMGQNPMPASFEVHLKADYANSDSLKQVIPALKQDPSILDVSYPESLMESLNNNIRKASTIMLIIALLLAFVSFALINNTIRLNVHSHRFLIYTMTLVGASWSFIRRPFLIKAFWIGFVSAFVAAAFLVTGIYAIQEYEPNMISLITWDVMTATLAAVFLCGILLTLLCAFFSVNRNLGLNYDKLHRY
ncbi:MAG: permease-like cell division protein FtsX [Bacteroidaceae bacterium]|jgi:cell division transport system permease protein|nr:permease-like cell division protein FtsX [Bacteroidaceae bacterium]